MQHPPDTDSGPLKRWSQLKQENQDAGVALPEAPSVDAGQDASPHEPLTDADMPDLDSMDEDSDYAAFLSPQVSDRLRARALRQLFRLPSLAVRDGLDDYDDDFTSLPTATGLVTHEMRRMLARELGREEGDAPLPGCAGQETPAVAQSPVDEVEPDGDTGPEKDA